MSTSPSVSITPDDVVAFWRDAGPARWFGKDAVFDQRFHDAFGDAHFAAARRELDHWMDSAEGALALQILLDQFPRNAFRGTAHMFATDALALALARRALAKGFDLAVAGDLRLFFYLAFEHSEVLDDQRIAVERCAPLGGQYADYARVHCDVIERFGRFPHRNAALGRDTTPEEQAFLDAGGFSG
ncbi:DUF924 family protein [Xanthomonadaceae bacterium JHOS43]|nr:DUF924 family protein [Xanthomonadaceae bacterium JHOS43]MCX7562539.1 DUF924 family protein [Xanthomonadaceae bacterium XH05]